MNSGTLQKQLGDAIRRERAALSHSQESFADLIKMHRAYYSAIERGERNLTLQTLHRVAKGLGMRMSEILAGADL